MEKMDSTEESTYWQQFKISGRVDDYLRYCACTEETELKEERLKEGYAGLCRSDRSHTEDGAYRGI